MNYVVCGPPGSGKTTFVREHCYSGDLIIDHDAIFQAVSGLEMYDKPTNLQKTVAAVRDFLIDQVAKNRVDCRNTWLITGGASVNERYTLSRKLGGARVYVLEVTLVECLRRIGQDPRRAGKVMLWQPIIHKWWEAYERDENDIRVKSPDRVI